MCDILFVFRPKGIFLTKQNGPSYFSAEKRQQGQILKFFHVCWWVVKQQKENAGIQSESTQNSLLTFAKTVDWGCWTTIIMHFCFLQFKSALNGHRTLQSVTLLLSSSFASPSVFPFDFTHCGISGHHVWWVQGLHLWRQRSNAEYIITAISLEDSQEMRLTGNWSRQVSQGPFSRTEEAVHLRWRFHSGWPEETLAGLLHTRQVQINCNLWLQPITLWLPRQTTVT